MQQQFIEKSPSQTVFVSLGVGVMRFNFYAFRDIMYVDIFMNDTYIYAGRRIIANQWLLPSYLTGEYGNIRFETYKSDENDYVWWEGFNDKFRLMAYSSEEYQEIEDGTE